LEESVRDYARLRLTHSREELETARQNIANGHHRAAASRAYYAVFYMASAALFAKSITRSKHSAVEAAFSQFLVKPGEIEPEFSRIYQMTRRQREDADYAEEPVLDKESAQQTLENAESFVDRIERYLRETGVL
jgi:uncharacterized protein